MASYSHITISESHESRQVSKSPSESVCRQNFTLIGAKSIKEAERCICAYEAPDDIDMEFKRARVNIDISPKFYDSENTDNSIIEVQRTYTVRQGATEIRLTMTTVTATVTVATRAVAAPGSFPFWDAKDYAAGGSKDNLPIGAGSFINVRRNSQRFEVAGIDAAFPTYKLGVSFECSDKVYQKLEPLLLRSAGTINSDVFLDKWQPGECLFVGFDTTRIADSINIETGEPEINYRIDYSFDVSRNEDYIAGKFIIPKEEKTGFSVDWHYAPTEEEVEIEGEDGEKMILTRPLIEGAYSSEIFPRHEFAKLIPSGIEI